jgi:hypothetical protein
MLQPTADLNKFPYPNMDYSTCKPPLPEVKDMRDHHNFRLHRRRGRPFREAMMCAFPGPWEDRPQWTRVATLDTASHNQNRNSLIDREWAVVAVAAVVLASYFSLPASKPSDHGTTASVRLNLVSLVKA